MSPLEGDMLCHQQRRLPALSLSRQVLTREGRGCWGSHQQVNLPLKGNPFNPLREGSKLVTRNNKMKGGKEDASACRIHAD